MESDKDKKEEEKKKKPEINEVESQENPSLADEAGW